MAKTLLILVVALSALLTRLQAEDLFLVQDGQPRAEIVIAETPQRSARLAAQELQHAVEKISDAKLPIAMMPSADVPVQIYVGRSAHTDRLKDRRPGT